MDSISADEIKYCREINQKTGKNYYFATLFYPKAIRDDIFVLYAFARVSDQFVDDGDYSLAQKRDKLEEWKEMWTQSASTGMSDNIVLRATAKLFSKHSIPLALSFDFLDAMLLDTQHDSYETFESLKEYMYGSAAVIGRMIVHIVGYSDETAFNYADDLAYAMQMTNFLRDIREDYEDLQRVYMPQQELSIFNLTPVDFQNHVVDERMIDFMTFQIDRVRGLYRHAREGISLLNEGRYAIRLSSYVYESILDDIEKHGYNIYTGRRGPGFLKKSRCLLRALR